jgi:HAD superfamily hydrolase (TIGR01490 family)
MAPKARRGVGEGFILQRMGFSEPAAAKRAAFFDLDKTLVPGSSLFLLARAAYARDLLRIRDFLRFARGQAMFRLRGENPKGMEISRKATLDFVAGRSRNELVAWGREIAEERILPRVYENIVRVIDGYRESGDVTVLVTAAPFELAAMVAHGLGMTDAIGTVAETDEQGFYTGRLVNGVVHGPKKAEAVADMAGRYGIDLGQCAAYSDSINDLPLLESVGYPHAVNPDNDLRRVALTRGWPIHELRTRRRALLIGIPAGLGGVAVFGSGIGLGMALERRRQKIRLTERIGRRLPLRA